MKARLEIFNKSNFFLLVFILLCQNAFTQNNAYRDTLVSYQQNYINTHEVVGKDDRKFIQFYPIDISYRVLAFFKKIEDKTGFDMNTSSGKQKKFFQYGVVDFKLNGVSQHLFIYQSAELIQQEKYKDYLFIPFGDATSGFTSYGGGRYIDLNRADIKDGKLLLDFNKAYNPYCAYTSGYNCPIPPKENLLKISIKAGEKNYGKPVH
jgi:uncharacterized protein